jgi:hypothetical protein
MPSYINKEKVEKSIQTILEKIHTEADPVLLNEYRSLIRKNVSFFRRSYLAAYLLMRLERQDTGKYRGNDKSGSPGEESFRPDSNRSLPGEETVRLFISIGRNRRVYPREILGLINAQTQVGRDDIGTIRILDNYSFIQVRTTVADDIIAALNGRQFRGRTLTVNYARNRKEENAETEELPEE